MPRMLRVAFVVGASLLALALAGLGCGTGRFVQRGINCYNAGDYPCALAAFQDIEVSGYQLNSKARVRYLAYRGLTHFRVGHLDMARRFLAEANAAYRGGDPAWLPPQVVTEMSQALAQLSGGAMPPSAPPPGPPGPAPTPAEPTNIQ
jgi:hypothetical protein